MIYLKTFTLIILIIFSNKSLANENIVEILKKNNNIIFLRHAIAPGNGDPENINLNDCDTQRNLNLEGINQSKRIGSSLIYNLFPMEHPQLCICESN